MRTTTSKHLTTLSNSDITKRITIYWGDGHMPLRHAGIEQRLSVTYRAEWTSIGGVKPPTLKITSAALLRGLITFRRFNVINSVMRKRCKLHSDHSSWWRANFGQKMSDVPLGGRCGGPHKASLYKAKPISRETDAWFDELKPRMRLNATPNRFQNISDQSGSVQRDEFRKLRFSNREIVSSRSGRRWEWRTNSVKLCSPSLSDAPVTREWP